MRYEVRYIVNGNEQSEIVEGGTAAEAAEIVQSRHPEPTSNFELVQVQLLDKPSTDNVDARVEHA